MSNSIARICLLLASTNEPTAQIRAFARWVDEIGPEEFYNVIDRLRHNALPKSISSSRAAANRASMPMFEKHKDSSGRVSVRSINNNAALKVEQLLIEEAGLSKSEAARRLALELQKEGISGPIPEYGRSGFTYWLKKVLDQVPESIVLFIATRLRNGLVHDNRPLLDWSLKRDKSE